MRSHVVAECRFGRVADRRGDRRRHRVRLGEHVAAEDGLAIADLEIDAAAERIPLILGLG